MTMSTSMIGLVASSGTAVLPTCSMRSARGFKAGLDGMSELGKLRRPKRIVSDHNKLGFDCGMFRGTAGSASGGPTGVPDVSRPVTSLRNAPAPNAVDGAVVERQRQRHCLVLAEREGRSEEKRGDGRRNDHRGSVVHAVGAQAGEQKPGR